MDMHEHLELNNKEKEILASYEALIKEDKLKVFLFHLLENQQWDCIVQLLNNEIPFYTCVDTGKIFEKRLKDMTSSLFKCGSQIKKIMNIQEEQYYFIKEKFAKHLVDNLLEIQQIGESRRQEPYYIETIELAAKMLMENPQLSPLYDKVELEKIKVIKNMVEMENKFPPKNNNGIKKTKI